MHNTKQDNDNETKTYRCHGCGDQIAHEGCCDYCEKHIKPVEKCDGEYYWEGYWDSFNE